MLPEEQPRILVVDDEESILDFVELGLTNQGYQVARARDGRSALRQFDAFQPNGVVLDIMLPDLDGIQVCQRLRALSNVPILMLTAKGDLDDKVLGLDSGADDYLPKPFKFKELAARLRALLRRSGCNTGNTVTFADIVLDRASRRVRKANRQLELTTREFELLDLLMERPHQVFTRQQILNRLWGLDFEGESNVVEVHIRALRLKLGDEDRRLIRTIRGIGYTLGG
ncbi:MAG TPA: response regulator transcription factor [Candidatus Xenobia bacterium]|jgi:two-component system response regulator MprA